MNKSRIFRNAHKEMKQSNYTADWSSCLKTAYAIERKRMQKRPNIIAKLKTGLVAFQFTKKDGSTRTAFGTLDSSLFNYEAKGGKSFESVDYVRYWDLEKNAWRMVKLDNFLGFVPLIADDTKVEITLDYHTSVLVDVEAAREYIKTTVPNDEFGDCDLVYVDYDNSKLAESHQKIGAAFIDSVYNSIWF